MDAIVLASSEINFAINAQEPSNKVNHCPGKKKRLRNMFQIFQSEDYFIIFLFFSFIKVSFRLREINIHSNKHSFIHSIKQKILSVKFLWDIFSGQITAQHNTWSKNIVL